MTPTTRWSASPPEDWRLLLASGGEQRLVGCRRVLGEVDRHGGIVEPGQRSAGENAEDGRAPRERDVDAGRLLAADDLDGGDRLADDGGGVATQPLGRVGGVEVGCDLGVTDAGRLDRRSA